MGRVGLLSSSALPARPWTGSCGTRSAGSADGHARPFLVLAASVCVGRRGQGSPGGRRRRRVALTPLADTFHILAVEEGISDKAPVLSDLCVNQTFLDTLEGVALYEHSTLVRVSE